MTSDYGDFTALPPTLSVDEAAALLGISSQVALAAARNGQLPTLCIGDSVLVPTARLAAVLTGGALFAELSADEEHAA